MGRPWREELKGGIYHVIARGNNKEYIFQEGIDKGYFIKLLKTYQGTMLYRVFGYILMDNHYHLIIQTHGEKLQKVMHQINNQYSKYYNFKYKRVGHVFQGRYKAVMVQDERYLVKLLRYVHQNPVKAGIARVVEDYKWSSDIYYRKSIKGFVNTSVILSMLGKDFTESMSNYRIIMEEEEETDFDSLDSIGEEAYQIMCKSRKHVDARKRLDEVLIETGVSKADYDLIKKSSRKRHLTEYKLKYIQAALELKYTFREIAENIGITESAVKDILMRLT